MTADIGTTVEVVTDPSEYTEDRFVIKLKVTFTPNQTMFEMARASTIASIEEIKAQLKERPMTAAEIRRKLSIDFDAPNIETLACGEKYFDQVIDEIVEGLTEDSGEFHE